jgi:hypothetical protein
MNINTAKEHLEQNGYKLEQIYRCSSSNLSVLHANACKEFLNGPLSLHEFYCDMKRLEAIESGRLGVAYYNKVFSFLTEIDPEGNIANALNAVKSGYVDAVLVFERTGTDPKPYPVPAGKVYKIVKGV